MNIMFWALMLIMLLVAVVILIYPLLRVRSSTSIAYKDSNLGLYEDKVAELEADLGEGRIDHERYQLARQEIDRELLQDVPEESRDTAGFHYGHQVKRQPGVAMLVSVFLPAMALLVYMQLGMHAASEQGATQQAQTQTQPQTAQDVGSIEDMTRQLAERINTNGGTVEEWAMLGRAYKHLKKYQLSAEAFAKAVEISQNPQLMLEQAEAMALANNQRFTPESLVLIRRALEMSPDNANVLWFAGVAEFQAGNYRDTIAHLSRLPDEARKEPDVDHSIRLYIEKAREALIAQGESVPSMDEILPPVAETATSGASIKVSVNISQDVREKFGAADSVFVYAKAASGPKMPLAVQKISLAELPAIVLLDDSMAMMEGMNLSSFDSVIISARITKTGSAMAQAGDYIGEYRVDDVAQASQVDIEINTLVQ